MKVWCVYSVDVTRNPIMEADWDADDFEPPTPVTAVTVKSDKWEGEDEEEQVKESWEDEETEATSESKPQAAQVPTKKKSSKRLEEKIAEKERKAKEEAEARKRLQEANMTPEERLAEKLRQQKLVEEADLEVAMETFGVSSEKGGGVLDNADPSSKDEFVDFKTNLVRKIQSLSGKPNYNDFIEEFLKDVCAGLDVEVLKKVSQTAKSLHEEKLRMVKAAAKPGKKGKTKVALKMDRNVTDYVDDYGGGDYDDFM